MFTSPLSKTALAAAACLALAACKSDEERADKYFQSGLELLESGDKERAMVQFLNVFEFNEAHLPTRQALARYYMDLGRPAPAYRQFLVISDHYPNNFEARSTLAQLAFAANDWTEFERHGTVAVELNPEDPGVQAIDLGLKYRIAAIEEDDPAMDALVAPAEALLETLPQNKILNNLLVDHYARNGMMNKALERLDVMISAARGDRQLYERRIAALAQMRDYEGMEAQLRAMVEQFSGADDVKAMMLRFYMERDELDKAEDFLRSISDPADEDPARFVSLIEFVSQVHGEEAAREEIQRAIAENPNPNRFKAMLSLMDFQAGRQEAAIADVEAILAEADVTKFETHAIKVTLAKMLTSTGNPVGARRQVEEVLAQNHLNVEALKMQATWQLQADEVGEAIANLRLALDAASEDTQIMNLMHDAYMRMGEPDLAREYLALAVEASGHAPEASLRYAELLANEARYLSAEDVLLPALRQSPGNVDLLSLLGHVYLRLEDFPRTTQVIETLKRLDTEETRSIATSLQVETLNQQAGTEEAMTYLEGLARYEGSTVRTQLMLMRAQLLTGDTEAALTIAEDLASENPNNLGIKLALANAQAANADLATAETTLREITQARPEVDQPWLQRVRIARRMGDAEKARTLIDEAMAATNRHPNIMWAQASLLERDGDIDGAIAIYEELYAQNSDSVIVANNLSSLLATYKDDPESLERAWVVGRRLRDADNPALQDTYGWILFRRGEVEEALPYLENAAVSLDDPIVQAHLGFAYAALDRNTEALTQMQRAVDMAGPADTRARIEAARAEIARLQSLPEN